MLEMRKGMRGPFHARYFELKVRTTGCCCCLLFDIDVVVVSCAGNLYPCVSRVCSTAFLCALRVCVCVCGRVGQPTKTPLSSVSRLFFCVVVLLHSFFSFFFPFLSFPLLALPLLLLF